MHIVIVDNGRSEHLGKENFWQALKCIRCGACMNTCPVYRRSGGYSYGYTIPGPIGTILTPLIDLERYSDLPFACTLCGSCTDVCPVKINIHEQIYRWRQQVYERGYLSETKKAGLKIAGRILSKPNLYQKAGAMMRFLLKHAPRFIIYNRMNIWGKSRELPKPPPQTFKEWYKENHKKL
jgi:L-lactate dehydrogenase complex protein LldF